MGNPDLLALGPGVLYTAPIGSSEPTDLVAAWPGSWVQLGYTHEGNAFSYELTVENIEVAEELEPVDIVPTSRAIKVAFSLAEVTATNLQLALNGGTIATPTGLVTFEPPDTNNMTKRMYGWESNDAEERWIYRKCFNSGTVEIPRRKGADKAVIPFELMLMKPTGVAPFKTLLNTVRA